MTDLAIFRGLGQVSKEAAAAVCPLLVLLLFFGPIFKLPRKLLRNTLKGLVIAFVGLIFFLQGVKIGFMPVGREIGGALGNSPYAWSLIPIGFLLGFAATFAEPAVRILSSQVEKASTGYIRSELILYTLSISVAPVSYTHLPSSEAVLDFSCRRSALCNWSGNGKSSPGTFQQT